MREKRREIRGCPEKQKQKLNLNFLEYRLGLGTKNNFKKMWIIVLVILYHIA